MEILIGAVIVAAIVFVIVKRRKDSKPGTGAVGGKNSSDNNTQLK